jgi:methylated-DNA-protein-cysteine methyltransferase-like protein
VASYGQVARMVGRPRNARFVGYALHVNPEPGIIPCHRVVFRDGSLAPGFAFGGEDVRPTERFETVERDEHVALAFRNDGRVDFFAETDGRNDASAALRHAVDFALFDVKAGDRRSAGEKFRRKKNSLSADAD